jgi:hypothetical protein
MPVLDFREIPTSARGAERDQFELFASEFLNLVGFRIIEGPDRGPDAGRDLIVEELRTGVAGETRVKWLVSCRHKAHTGVSVTPEDEPDIHDRVATHGCNGFMGFYSTLPSSGLSAKLNAAPPFEVQVYNSERIERELLKSETGADLARRFFPKSFAAWGKEHHAPAHLVSTSAMQIVFPNECNLPSKESLFRRSTSPFPDGSPIQSQLSIHRFFVGVKNTSQKTLHNVRLVLEDLSGAGPGRVLNASCFCERTNRETADIPPQGMDYFLIGEGNDSSDKGIFHPAIMSKDEYERLLHTVEARSHVGFVLQPINARYDLLRNDGYRLHITAYADDAPPNEKEFIINARELIEIFLVQ